MNHHLPRRGRLWFHAAISVLIAAATLAAMIFLPINLTACLALAGLAVFVYLMLRALNQLLIQIRDLNAMVRRLEEENLNSFRQIESLMSIYAVLQPAATLPATRVWAMSPDLLREITSITLGQRPRLVLEASSGTSTLIIAYCLKRLGSGRLLSLEHDGEFASQTTRLLASHGLDSFARVIHAPLVAHRVDGREMMWYDLSEISSIDCIDLFVIDGPPAKDETDNQARFPALPLLYDRLAPGCQIILDDAARAGEQAIAEAWTQRYPDIQHRYLDLEKGASIFVKDKGRDSA